MNTIDSFFNEPSAHNVKGSPRDNPSPIQKAIFPVLDLVSNQAQIEAKKQERMVRKTVLKEEELIKRYENSELSKGSLLREAFGSDSEHYASLLGQIHGDRVIQGSSLEKAPAYLGSRLLKSYLQKEGFCSESKGCQELVLGLQGLAELEQEIEIAKNDKDSKKAFFELANKIMKSVSELQEETPFFLPGEGAEDGLNYSVLYEFRKNKDATYDLFVYSLGKEGNLYGEFLGDEKKHKSRVPPFRHFKAIPSSSLFFTGDTINAPRSDLFQAILASKITHQKDFCLKPQFLAQQALSFYREYLAPNDIELNQLLSAARAHTNALHLIKGLTYRFLGRENYKKCLLDLKVKTLIEGAQLVEEKLSQDTEKGSDLRAVLKSGATAILRHIALYQREGWISDETALLYRGAALAVQKKVETFETQVYEKRLQQATKLNLPDTLDDCQKRVEALKMLQSTISDSNQKHQTLSVQTAVLRLPSLWSPADFTAELARFLEVPPNNLEIQAAEIEHLVAKFPIPQTSVEKNGTKNHQDNFWEMIPLKSLPKAIKNLEKMLLMYESSRPVSYKTPHQVNTVYAVFAVVHFLAVRLDESKKPRMAKLSSCSIYFPGEQNQMDPFLTFPSVEDFNRRKEIESYFTAINEKGSPSPFKFHKINLKASSFPPEIAFFVDFVRSRKAFKNIDGLNQKDILVQLFNDFSFEGKLLESGGFGYLRSLVYASIMAHRVSGYTKVSQGTGLNFYIYREDSISTFEEKTFHPSESLYPSLSKGNKVLLSAGLNRNRKKIQSEGGILLGAGESQNDKFLERDVLEPSLYPHEVLHDFKNRLEELANFEQQTLFELIFFRTLIIEGEERFPLKEALEQAGFVQACRSFIREGVELFYERQIGGKPNVFATLFFLRLSNRLACFIKQPLFETHKYIRAMLLQPDLSKEEKSALSLHLILSYRVEKNRLSFSDITRLFAAWIYYRNNNLPSSQRNGILEAEAASFIQILSSDSLNLDEGLKRDILKQAFIELNIKDFPDQFEIEEGLPISTIRGKSLDGGYWEVNLTTGEVCTNTGKRVREGRPYCLRDEQSEDHKFYDFLFGSRKHKFLNFGGFVYYFTDPYLGQVRVKATHHFEEVERLIENEWCRYVFPKDLPRDSIPEALIKDHSHWIPVSCKNKLWICDFKTGRQKALLNEEGEIKVFDGSLSNQTIHRIADQHPLCRMDSQGYILVTKKDEQLKKVEYSRFFSQAAEPLFFECEKGKLVYGLHRAYHLSDKQHDGLIGKVQNYLVLTHEKGEKQKLLVPRTSFRSNQDLEALQLKEGVTQSQRRNFTFFEYDLQGGLPIPLNDEGNLHLAYLYLSQRQYEQAKELIEQINPRQKLSSIAVEILDDMIQFVEKKQDSSPEASAIALSAYRLYTQSKKRFQDLDACTLPERAFDLYCRNHTTLPESLIFYGKVFTKKREDKKDVLASIVDRQIDELKLPLSMHLRPRDEYASKYYENDFNRMFSFLYTDGPKNLEPPILFSMEEFVQQGFFWAAYEIARNGSQEEKMQLKFRLNLMDLFRTEQQRHPAWTILQCTLLFPKESPNLVKADEKVRSKMHHFKPKIEDFSNLVENKRRNRAESKQQSMQSPTLSTTFKTVFPDKKRVEKVAQPLTLAAAGQKAIDQGFILELSKNHVQDVTPKESEGEKISFAYPISNSSSEEEQSCAKAIETEFAEFQAGFDKGSELNAKRKLYQLRDIAELKSALEKKRGALETDLQNLEITILEIANVINPKEAKQKELLREAKIEQELSLKKLIWLFLSSDRNVFAKANPYLNSEAFEQLLADKLQVNQEKGIAIDYLYNLIGLYLSTSVYKKRLDRAHMHCQKLVESKEPSLSPLEKEDLEQKVALELNPDQIAIYDIHQNPTFLVFEYCSGLSIRPNQASNLLKMLQLKPNSTQFRNLVIQMMMGEGKTSVLAVILLKLAASEGKLSLFGTPSSQYSSVGHNLRKALKEYFDQEMEEIDFPADQIYDKCQEIEKRLKKTMERGDFAIVKSETLLCLQLKLVTAIFAGIEKNSPNLNPINTLRRIFVLLRKSGEIIMDEVDLILHILREMNFPIGEEQHVSAARIDLIRQLFTLFVSEEAKIDETTSINLKQLIDLQENRQTLLQEKEWKETIAKAVAWRFTKESKSLFLHKNPDHQLSFYRYITGKMNQICQQMLDHPQSPDYKVWEDSLDEQDKKDFAFLSYVKQLRAKPGEKEEAAHQIALIKQMITTILPQTFQKMGNRHFGRSRVKPGEVRPYLAVDTPSTNYFGYIYEWIAYHFQTVLQCGIEADQLKVLAEIYQEGAANSLKSNQLVIDEKTGEMIAPEAYEFKKLTNVNLEEIDRPGKLQEALEYVNQHDLSKLSLEAATASEQVIYHPHRVTANGFSLINMCNARVMSATPYNAHCYEDCLADNFQSEPETEGQIAALALKRIATKEKTHIHFVKSKTLNQILQQTLEKHPQKEKVRMVLDSGALFKDYTNLEVAKEMRRQLNKPILFFMRDPNKEELTPDSLALLPLDSDIPRIIGGTRLEEIEKAGCSLEEYCIYADERHTTGTDVPLPFDSIGVMTIDHSMLRRTFFQSILRLRQYFSHQTIEFIIPEEILPIFPENTSKNEELKIALGLIMTTIRNQALQKAKDYFRSRKQKIDSILEQKLLKQVLIERDLTQSDLQKLTAFKAVLELPQADTPYDQFGALECAIDSIEELKAYKEKRIAAFRKAEGDAQLASDMEQEMDAVIAKASQSPWLSKTVSRAQTKELGLEVDILTEVNQEIAQEVLVEIDYQNEIEEELHQYRVHENYHNLRPETSWKETEIKSLLSATFDKKRLKIDLKIIEQLKEILIDVKVYENHYEDLFDDSILATDNWSYTSKVRDTIFSQHQKPAEQLLVLKTDSGYKVVLLSLQDAKAYQDYLKKYYNTDKTLENVWLIMPDQTSLIDNPHGPIPLYALSKTLLQINALNGNIPYLEAHPEETRNWMKGKEELACRFLKLKCADNPVKRKQLACSFLLLQGKGGPHKKIFASHIKDVVSNLSPEKIKKLGKGDEHLISKLSKHQLQYLDPQQIPLLNEGQKALLEGKKVNSGFTETKDEDDVEKPVARDAENLDSLWFFSPADENKDRRGDFCDATEDLDILLSPSPSDENKDRREDFCDATEDLDILLSPSPSDDNKGRLEDFCFDEVGEEEEVEEEIVEEEVPVETVASVTSNSNGSSTSSFGGADPLPALKPSPLSTSHDMKKARCARVTKIALVAIGAIICIAASLAGGAALIGTYASWAPRFTVSLSQTLNMYSIYILTAAGPAYLFGLVIVMLIQKKRREAMQQGRV